LKSEIFSEIKSLAKRVKAFSFEEACRWHVTLLDKEGVVCFPPKKEWAALTQEIDKIFQENTFGMIRIRIPIFRTEGKILSSVATVFYFSNESGHFYVFFPENPSVSPFFDENGHTIQTGFLELWKNSLDNKTEILEWLNFLGQAKGIALPFVNAYDLYGVCVNGTFIVLSFWSVDSSGDRSLDLCLVSPKFLLKKGLQGSLVPKDGDPFGEECVDALFC